MTAPQIIVALWLLVGLTMSVWATARSDEFSNGECALGILWHFVSRIAFALFLSWGGFW